MRSLFALRQLALVVVCALWALSAARPDASAQGGLPPVLNPKTVASPSGAYTLWVNPSERYGAGEATYRLKRKGRVVWEGTRPYTLYEVGVTNDGTVGGYAYSDGLEGRNRKHPEDGGDFEVVILAPTGRTRLLQKTRRVVYSGPEFHFACPSAERLIVDVAHDRMIVQVVENEKGSESWRRYQLSTGRILPAKAPPHFSESVRKEPSVSSVPKQVRFTGPLIGLVLRDRIDLHLPAEEAGERPSAESASAFHEVAVRQDGWILAVDARAGTVNMFDPQGHWRTVHASVQLAKEARSHLHFLVRQIELEPNSAFSLQGEQFDREGNSHGIVAGLPTLFDRVHAIQRRPDNTWMEPVTVSEVATAPDGALAVLENGLLLYSARNEPERMIPLPAAHHEWEALAYDGTQIVLSDGVRLYCYGRNGKARWQFMLPQIPAMQHWTPFITDAGHTLCLFDGQCTLYRYVLP